MAIELLRARSIFLLSRKSFSILFFIFSVLVFVYQNAVLHGTDIRKKDTSGKGLIILSLLCPEEGYDSHRTDSPAK